MKKGFTIVELLMVIAILGVLLGIVTTAATASIRQSRERQAKAMQNTLQNGIAAYRARKFGGVCTHPSACITCEQTVKYRITSIIYCFRLT